MGMKAGIGVVWFEWVVWTDVCEFEFCLAAPICRTMGRLPSSAPSPSPSCVASLSLLPLAPPPSPFIPLLPHLHPCVDSAVVRKKSSIIRALGYSGSHAGKTDL